MFRGHNESPLAASRLRGRNWRKTTTLRRRPMVREDRGQTRWNLWVKGASFLAVIAGVLLLTSSGNQTRHNLQALAPPMADSKTPGNQLLGKGDLKPFRDWPPQPPDLTLILTGQMHGYYNPCGCSRPQLGGLERRYNFI